MSTYAIIGSGNIGGTLARLLTARGHEVILANSRGPETLADLVAELGHGASAATASDAVAAADVVIEAIPFGKLGTLADLPWENKVLLSAANFYAGRDAGDVDLEGLTHGAYTAKAIPGARVAKVFNTIYYVHLGSQGDTDKPLEERRALPYVADDEEAGRVAAALAEELGFAPLNLGGLGEGRGANEPDGALYNKNLTLAEAQEIWASLG